MKVMKFGGSSLADAGRIRTVARIIADAKEKDSVAVVLSAMKGVTDALLDAASAAEKADPSYKDFYQSVCAKHHTAMEELLPEDDQSDLRAILDSMFTELKDILHGVELVRECSPRTRDLVAGFGERLSCCVVAAYLSSQGAPSRMVDARTMILTDENHGAASVVFGKTYGRVAEMLGSMSETPVITGFIAATPDGITTTLGRNGSDYTASIVAAGIGADLVEIWTDVDGVMSADPRYVPAAFVLPEITVEEAMELSYFGAEVIHPYTMIPAVEKNIPLRIKNTMNPSAPGTLIGKKTMEATHGVTGIASIESVALINVSGGGMVGIPGIASRVFRALASAGVNIIMISQASSEHSICIVFRAHQAEKALSSLHKELARELESRKIDQFELMKDLEIVAVIGSRMQGTPGISGRLFSALGNAGINVLAIAQGSSEMNISFVVNGGDRRNVLNVVHNAFFPERAL
jgi:bifunctional aspartokinase / homoserine dehydrogenase 1